MTTTSPAATAAAILSIARKIAAELQPTGTDPTRKTANAGRDSAHTPEVPDGCTPIDSVDER